MPNVPGRGRREKAKSLLAKNQVKGTAHGKAWRQTAEGMRMVWLKECCYSYSLRKSKPESNKIMKDGVRKVIWDHEASYLWFKHLGDIL